MSFGEGNQLAPTKYVRKVFRLLVIVLSTSVVPASADTWDQAIAAVDARSEELWSLARERGFQYNDLGRASNEIHSREHSCSILGRMLGKIGEIEALEKSVEFDILNADSTTTGLAAQSLANWVFNAEKLLNLSADRKAEIWNLDCVGQFGIASSSFVARSGESTFYDIDGTNLRILGDIEIGFSEKLEDVLSRNDEIEIVSLGSGGGAVYEAMAAGLIIRNMGLDTSLWNNCYSACTIVFLGGVERTIWSPYPELAFHEVSRGGEAVPPNDNVYVDLAKYASIMNVDPQVFVGLMHLAPPSDFFVPPTLDLCDLKLATWVQRVC